MTLEERSRLKRLRFEPYLGENGQGQGICYLIRAFSDLPKTEKEAAEKLANNITNLCYDMGIKELLNSNNSPDFFAKPSSRGQYAIQLDPDSIGVTLNFATVGNPTEAELVKAQRIADILNAGIKGYVYGISQLSEKHGDDKDTSTRTTTSWFRRTQPPHR